MAYQSTCTCISEICYSFVDLLFCTFSSSIFQVHNWYLITFSRTQSYTRNTHLNWSPWLVDNGPVCLLPLNQGNSKQVTDLCCNNIIFLKLLLNQCLHRNKLGPDSKQEDKMNSGRHAFSPGSVLSFITMSGKLIRFARRNVWESEQTFTSACLYFHVDLSPAVVF